MKPNKTIIDLAKRFHKAGGTNGQKCNYGDWYYFAQTGNAELYVSMIDDWEYYADAGDIPILDESKLWAWLKKHNCRRIEQNKDDFLRILYHSADMIYEEFFDMSHNLHAALYAAAVWVAERKENHD